MPSKFEQLTAADLARIYIRAQDASGKWVNVNLAEATDLQFEAWAVSKAELQGDGDAWPQEERVSFANFVNAQVQELVMVPEKDES